MEEATDDELVRLALTDHKDAFRLLMERYQVMALCLTIRFTKNEEIARELVQEAMLQAYLSLGKLYEANKFKSWFYGITLNISRSWLRSQKGETFSLDTQEGTKLLEQSSCLIEDPQEQWATHELQHMVREAVGMLPVPNREVAYLFYYEEMSMQEIAHQLHISLSAVKNRLYKGRNQLRNHLNAHYFADVSSMPKRKHAATRQSIFANIMHPKYARVDLVFLLQVQRQSISSSPSSGQGQNVGGGASNTLHQHPNASNNSKKAGKKGANMQNLQKNRLQIPSVWVSIILTGLPLSLGFYRIILPNNVLTSIFIFMLAWMAFCAAIEIPARWLRKRIAPNMAVVFPAILILAAITFIWASYYNIGNNTGVYSFGSLIVSYGLVTVASIASLLIAKDHRDMYIMFHLINWLFWIGVAILLAPKAIYGSFYISLIVSHSLGQFMLWLLFPLICMFALLYYHKFNIVYQVHFSTQRTLVAGALKLDDQRDYQQGYQPVYEEGGTVYEYKQQDKAPAENPLSKADMMTMQIREKH